MFHHVRYIVVVLSLFVLSSCGTTKTVLVREPIAIPVPPKVVVMDNGKYDKSKYPNTEWVQEPKVDLNKRTATWGFDDINKISRALVEFPQWGVQVEKIIEAHNKGVNKNEQGSKDAKKPWYKVW